MTIFFSPKSKLSLEITPPPSQYTSEILCPWLKRPEEQTTTDSSTEWSILILCSHLRLGLPSGFFFFSLFPHNPVYIPIVSHACHILWPLRSLWLRYLIYAFKKFKQRMKIQIFWDMKCYLVRHYTVQNFPAFYFCVSRRSRHFPQHSLQNMISLWFFQKSSTPIQKQTTLWRLFLFIPTRCTHYRD